MHSIAIVAETRGITVDADALREEVLEEAPRALAAAPNAAEQLEKLEAELARGDGQGAREGPVRGRDSGAFGHNN